MGRGATQERTHPQLLLRPSVQGGRPAAGGHTRAECARKHSSAEDGAHDADAAMSTYDHTAAAAYPTACRLQRPQPRRCLTARTTRAHPGYGGCLRRPGRCTRHRGLTPKWGSLPGNRSRPATQRVHARLQVGSEHASKPRACGKSHSVWAWASYHSVTAHVSRACISRHAFFVKAHHQLGRAVGEGEEHELQHPGEGSKMQSPETSSVTITCGWRTKAGEPANLVFRLAPELPEQRVAIQRPLHS
jgi:hypothetical protein